MTNIIAAAINTRHTHSALALAYLKAYWQTDPERPEMAICEYDLNQTNEGIIADLILKSPDILAFSVYIWSLSRTLDIAGAVKAALPDTIIVLGGPEVSYNSEMLMQRYGYLDFIIRGEGEVSFAELLTAIIAGNATNDIAGITWRNGTNIQTNPDRELIADLDIIPSPFQAGFYKEKHSFTYYEASRGCPSKCSYCLSSVLGRLRHLSVERVEADLDWFFNSDYRQVRFADRTFNHDRARARRIISYIKANNHRNINIHFEIQADFLSEDIIELLADAPEGMFHLEIGVQSTNPIALAAVNRRFDLAVLKDRVLQLRKRTKCYLHLDLLGALPYDSLGDFLKSLDDVWLLEPHSIQISLVKVLRGTPLESSSESLELFSMPAPPYTILRTRWLNSSETIHIQDIGKLVEGIYNCQRYPKSLSYIVKHLFSGSASCFFSRLADYWRDSGLQFYNFSPENIARYLQAFVENMDSTSTAARMLPSLLEHELRMTQKVPVSSNPAVNPLFENVVRKTHYRLQAGCKALWYEYDPLLLSAEQLDQAATLSPVPVIYRFEKDLSLTPDVEVLEPGHCGSFIMAAVQARSEQAGWAPTWQRLWPNLPVPNFAEALEKLVESGLLYEQAGAQNNIRRSSDEIRG
ncbi:MAG: hypothetical protein CVV41_20820 [Candidatus Riflebacteria bacterium HGW-Riflebacteria-1]|jgi:radical SAM superfamily enzyme YgiQ (UPF0313 family)|nr:MAG: hypothetical protein CVV41_20820 [Candidatus Riflebacteria bacterium HGW-Riflebacteria-1]